MSKVCEQVSIIIENAVKHLRVNIYRRSLGRVVFVYKMVVFPLAGAVAVLVPASVPCQELAHLV